MINGLVIRCSLFVVRKIKNKLRIAHKMRITNNKQRTTYYPRSSIGLIVLVCGLVWPILSPASTWANLWQTPDQQGAAALEKNDAAKAAQLFQNSTWKASADYKSGDYQAALKNFSTGNTSDSFYNRGNALAHLQKYEEAIDAYNHALTLKPDNSDAAYNRDIVKKLLQQQQEQNKNKSQDKKSSNQKQQGKNSSEQKQQNQKSSQDQNSASQKQQDSSQQDKNNNASSKADKRSKNSPQNSQQANNQQNADAQQQKNNSSAQEGEKDESASNEKNQQSANNAAGQQSPAQAQQPQHASANSNANGQPQDKQSQALTTQHTEQDKQTKQWLAQIPDNPGGLLQQKFLRDHERLDQQQ